MDQIKERPAINYSCHISVFRDGEQLAGKHVIGMVLDGTMTLNDGESQTIFNSGDLYYARKNQMVKFIKHPPVGGEFKSLSISFDEQLLRDMSNGYKDGAEGKNAAVAFLKLPRTKSLVSFMETLSGYESLFQDGKAPDIMKLKQQEAILLLIAAHPKIKDFLFDFREPHKIDLEAFMNKNYHFNLHLNRFAYLTGRSLASFKRDFEKTFGSSPGKWLQQKRLKEAYYLIREKGKTASQVYLDLGFEDLSHFSFAFKKHFGIAPSQLV